MTDRWYQNVPTLKSLSEIDPSVENSDLFLRYSTMTPGIYFEVVGSYFWYDDPALHIERELNPETMQLSGQTVRPKYHRVSMTGGSFSTQSGPFLLCSEGAYYSGRYFKTAHPALTDAVARKDNLHYMAGVDYTLAGITCLNLFIINGSMLTGNLPLFAELGPGVYV